MVVQAQDMCLMRRRKRKQAKKEVDIIKGREQRGSITFHVCFLIKVLFQVISELPYLNSTMTCNYKSNFIHNIMTRATDSTAQSHIANETS